MEKITTALIDYVAMQKDSESMLYKFSIAGIRFAQKNMHGIGP